MPNVFELNDNKRQMNVFIVKIKQFKILFDCCQPDRRLVKKLYMNQKAGVRINNILSEECEIGRGNRQGYSLSALLYILYDEAMIKKTVDGRRSWNESRR